MRTSWLISGDENPSRPSGWQAWTFSQHVLGQRSHHFNFHCYSVRVFVKTEICQSWEKNSYILLRFLGQLATIFIIGLWKMLCQKTAYFQNKEMRTWEKINKEETQKSGHVHWRELDKLGGMWAPGLILCSLNVGLCQKDVFSSTAFICSWCKNIFKMSPRI